EGHEGGPRRHRLRLSREATPQRRSGLEQALVFLLALLVGDEIAFRLERPERVEVRLLEQRRQIVVLVDFPVLGIDQRHRRLGDYRLRQRVRDLLLAGSRDALLEHLVGEIEMRRALRNGERVQEHENPFLRDHIIELLVLGGAETDHGVPTDDRGYHLAAGEEIDRLPVTPQNGARVVLLTLYSPLDRLL